MVVGIDLGAASVRAAVAGRDHCSVVRLAESSVSIPSAVARVGDRLLLGERAAARASTNPDCVLLNPVEQMRHGKAVLGGKTFAQNEVVGWWLDEICARARQHREEEIAAVAVCAPSSALLDVGMWFDFATAEAGIPSSSTHASTSAAAVGAVASARFKSGTMALVDVGASQLEATIVQVDSGVVKLVSRARRANAGAMALDRKLAEAFVCDVASLETFRGLPGPVLLMLTQACERIRCDLTQVTEAKLSVPFLGPMLGRPDLPDWALDRFRLESLARPVADAVQDVCREAMELADVTADRVSVVAAVGGLSRMPLVRRELRIVFDKGPLGQIDPDAAAVCGAALLGAADLGWLRVRVDERDVREAPPAPPVDAGPTTRSSAPHVAVGAMLAANPPVVSQPPEPDEPAEQPVRVRDSQIRIAAAPPSEPVSGAERPSVGTMIRAVSSVREAPVERSRPSRAPGVDIPRSGGFRNALRAADLLDLPFTRPLTPADVSPPALPVLLMHYGRCKGLDAVVTLAHEEREVTLTVAGTKALVGSPRERAAFLAAFLWPEGSYRIETAGAASASSSAATESLAKVAIDGVREALGALSDEEIVEALGERFSMAPKATKRGVAMAEALDFWVGEQRFLEYRCDGSITVAEALKTGSISQSTALRVLFVIELLGQIRWEPPPRKVERSLREQVEEQAARVERADAFAAIGVHWSAPDDEVQAAHDALVERYGPGSAAAKEAPEAAATIVSKAREALPILLDRHKRIALLKRTRPDLDFQAVTDLMQKRAISLAMKGEDGDAQQAQRIQREVAPLSRQSGFDRRILRMRSSKPPDDESE